MKKDVYNTAKNVAFAITASRGENIQPLVENLREVLSGWDNVPETIWTIVSYFDRVATGSQKYDEYSFDHFFCVIEKESNKRLVQSQSGVDPKTAKTAFAGFVEQFENGMKDVHQAYFDAHPNETIGDFFKKADGYIESDVMDWFGANESENPLAIDWSVTLRKGEVHKVLVYWTINLDNDTVHKGSKQIESTFALRQWKNLKSLFKSLGNAATRKKEPKIRKYSEPPNSLPARDYLHFFYTFPELKNTIRQNQKFQTGRTKMWVNQFLKKQSNFRKAISVLKEKINAYLEIERSGKIYCEDARKEAYGVKPKPKNPGFITIEKGRGKKMIEALELEINLGFKFLQQQKMDISQKTFAEQNSKTKSPSIWMEKLIFPISGDRKHAYIKKPKIIPVREVEAKLKEVVEKIDYDIILKHY